METKFRELETTYFRSRTVIGFVVVGLAAFGLGLFVHWLEAFDAVPGWIVTAMKMLEQGLFVLDGVGFAFLAVMSSVELCGEIWRKIR